MKIVAFLITSGGGGGTRITSGFGGEGRRIHFFIFKPFKY